MVIQEFLWKIEVPDSLHQKAGGGPTDQQTCWLILETQGSRRVVILVRLIQEYFSGKKQKTAPGMRLYFPECNLQPAAAACPPKRSSKSAHSASASFKCKFRDGTS